MNNKMKITSALYMGLNLFFMIRCFFINNYEFLFYGTVLIGFWAIIMKTDKRMNYPMGTLIMLIVWLTGHLLGGTIYIGETKLYDLMLIPIVGEPYLILKYDQVMHVFCYIAMTRFIFVPVSKMLRDDAPFWLIGIITILAGCGIGAMNEIIEFGAVIWFDAADAVGGYTNTAIDIVANTVGAVIAWFTLLPGLRRSRSNPTT